MKNAEKANNSKLKILLISLFAVFLIFFGVVSYIVSTKVKPEEIRKLAKVELAKVFPNAEVDLGNIELGFGASISLNAEKFTITYPLKDKKVEIFKVDSISAKIPILTILLGGGAVDIAIDKPVVRYFDYGKSNLWQMAMEKDDEKGVATGESEQNRKSRNENDNSKAEAGMIALPVFVTNSSINLSLHEIALEYGTIDKLAGKVDINKLVIRNLGLQKDAAYEVNSKIMLSEDKDKNMSLKTLLIGEFSLKNFLEKGEIHSKALLTISDLRVPDLNGNFPEFKNDMEINVNKDSLVDVRLAGEFEKSNYKFNIQMNDKKININDINVDLLLMDIKNMLPEQTDVLNPGKVRLGLQGTVIMKDEKLYPDLNYMLSDYVGLSLPDMNLSIISRGRISDRKFSSKNTTRVFGGTIETTLGADIDLNSKSPDFEKKLSSYDLNVDMEKLSFEKSYLQKMLYPPEEKKKGEESAKVTEKKGKTAAQKKVVSENTIPLLPGGKIIIKARQINLGGKNMDAGGLILTKGNKVNIKNFKFALDKGEAVINTNLAMYKTSMKTDFSLSMKKINISSFDGLIPQQYSGSNGSFSGKVNGKATSAEKVSYDVNVDVNGTNGELKGIDLKPYLEGVINMVKKIPGLDKKIDSNKKLDYTGNFKTLALKGEFKPNHYQLKSAQFIGLDNMIEAKANGNIYPETKKEGKVYADIIENKFLSSYVEAYAGTRIIPVLFRGPGMTLNADYQYTLKKLSKNVINKNKSKVKKKAKEKIKNEVEKIFKGKGNKKIDKLLKGLF
jgi:hypothetical protein